MIRKMFFWAHLSCGVIAGLVVLMMSATGVILTYERQILAWHEGRAYSQEPTPGATRLPLSNLLAVGEAADFQATSVTLQNDAAAPVTLRAGRSGTLHLNPYSGAVYPPADEGLDNFFSAVTGWHRWFNVSGEGRSSARAITGAANLMFLFLVLSGIYLWLPGIIRWATLRGRLWFHRNARSGQARDFNWHHVFGIWSAIPLAVIVATATVFNYTWANDLVYRLAGDVPPRLAPPAAPATPDPAARPVAANGTGEPLSLDALFERAVTSEVAGPWRSITLTLPDTEATSVSFAIDQGNGGQPQKRHTLILDSTSGQVVAWQPFDSQTSGRQARSWVRFLHTGEALGIPGQTIAGLVSFFAMIMVWTGLALSLRRLLRFLQRRQASTQKTAQSASPLAKSTS